MELLLLAALAIFVMAIIGFCIVINTGSRTSQIIDSQRDIRSSIRLILKDLENISANVRHKENEQLEVEVIPEVESSVVELPKTVELEDVPIVHLQTEADIVTIEPTETAMPVYLQEAIITESKKESQEEQVEETIKPEPETATTTQIAKPTDEVEETTELGKVAKALKEVKEWIIIGDKYRAEGVSKEYAIATNWLTRIGIIIAVIGIGFGLRYSYQHGWIAPAVRVAMTALTGVAMIFFGLRLEGKKYELLGHGLLGGGITTLYFSVFSATHFYNLITPAVGMIVMALITATCGIIAVKFNSKLVAILGIIGGYATPIMMSTGSGNLPVLYSYMLLIGIGVLGITTVRNWYLIQFLGFICHWVLFIGSLIKYYDQTFFTVSIIFLTIFFLIFSFNSCVYHLIKRIKSTTIEVVMLILNSTIFSILGYGLIVDFTNNLRSFAILTISLAIVYTICSHTILRTKQKDRGLVLTFIGLSAFYTTITLPILLDAGWLTISWSLQALLMLWLSDKLNCRFLQSLSYTLYGITFISLITTLNSIYDPYQQSQYMALQAAEYFKSMLSHLLQVGIPTLSFFLARKIASRQISTHSTMAVDVQNDISEELTLNSQVMNVVMQTIFIVFLMTFAMIETNCFFRVFYLPLQTPATTAVIAGLIIYLLKTVKKTSNETILTLAVLATVLLIGKVVFIDTFETWHLQGNFIYQSGNLVQASFMRLLNFSILFAIIINCRKLFKYQDNSQQLITISSAVSLIIPFIFLTLETNTFLNQFIPGLRSGGVSILWSSYAIGLLASGIKKQKKGLRFTGLGLFIVVILKVFFHDLADLNELWRIVAFIILGCILFLGSFLYIRFQHLFTVAKEECK